MYPSNHAQAGLALIFTLITISLVSAAPVPLLSSTHSNRDLIQSNTTGNIHVQFPLVHGPISTHSESPTAGLTSDNNDFSEWDNHLVRRGLGAKIRAGFKKLFNGIKHVAQKIGSGIKKVAQKVGSGIKKVAQKIGSGIKKAAQKVGHFIKTTAGKVAKFGLKVISTIENAASKVASFIPGVGKIISKGLEAESKLTGFISDKIHANLGKKLEKGMKVMNIADKVMKFIPRRRDLSEEEAGFFQQRDTNGRVIYERAFGDDLDWEY
jgi:hypothetical protein